MSKPQASLGSWIALAREALRTGTIAGLAMIPFAALFRIFGLRINEYGRKTLELLVGEVASPLHDLLTFVQHMIISWVVYVAVNSLALPLAFGDPTPWQLGAGTVYPSLAVHLVYGLVLAWVARAAPGR